MTPDTWPPYDWNDKIVVVAKLRARGLADHQIVVPCKAHFGFRAATSFDDGLRRTIEWYCARPGNTSLSNLGSSRT